jgi:perosamine synthetase
VNKAQRYQLLLQSIPYVELPPLALPRRTISWFVYVLLLTSAVDREGVQAYLAERGIATGRYFAPIHLQRPWRLAAQGTDLRLTEKVAGSALALPLFNRITIEQQEEVTSTLQDAIRRIERIAAK